MSQETFGAALKRWRENHQLSVRGLAARAHYSKSQISGLENGRLVRPEVARHLDQLLQADGELIALAEPERRAHQRDNACDNADPSCLGGARYYTVLATQLLIEPNGWNDMQRRTFVLGAGGMAGLSLTAAPALALETARHGLTLTLAHPLAQQRADVAVDEWQAIIAEYGYSYLTMPPSELLGLLMVDVLGIQYAMDYQQQRQAGDSDTNLQELRRAGALLATLMAMTVANLGQVPQAVRWWRSARTTAVQSGDVDTEIWVRGREVTQAVCEQRPLGLMLRLIDEAEARAQGASSRALRQLVSGKAQILALAGRAGDAAAALHQLQDIHAALPGEATADGHTIFDCSDYRLHYTASFVYSQLGQVEQAATAQAQTLAAYPAHYRRGPAQIELQRALCMVRSDDTTGGVRHAQTILAGLSPADHIRPIFDLSRRVLDAVPPARHPDAAVAELRDCLTMLDASRRTPLRADYGAVANVLP